MNVKELIAPEFVLLGVDGCDKETIIARLASSFFSSNRISCLDKYVSEVLRREGAVSTNTSSGIAIPHACSDTVLYPSIGFARFTNPVAWGNEDLPPVKMVFLLAVPYSKREKAHLEIIAALARLLVDEEVRGKLMSLNSKEEIIDLLDRNLSCGR